MRVRGALARVAARGPGSASVHVNVYQVAVENGPVGGCAHGRTAQLELLLGVSELQCTGALVGRRFLSIRQADGGWQVDVLLQVRVGGLEAAESVPLHKWCVEALSAPWPVHHLSAEEMKERF